MPSPTHELIVKLILAKNPDARVDGFDTYVQGLITGSEPRPTECVGCEEDPCTCRADWDGWFAEVDEPLRFRPDAWAVRESDGRTEVVCWEAHVTTTPKSKTPRYVEAYWALDSLGEFRLRLINVDVFGNETEVDLFEVGSDHDESHDEGDDEP